MKTILLTGASGGIGSAISEALRTAGHTVIGVTREDADVTAPEAVRALKERMLKNAAQIDWLVCAHGFIDAETNLEKERPEDIRKTFDVNIVSLLYLLQQFQPHLSHNGGMIALSSSAGLVPNGKYAAYSASKAAVNAFMLASARANEQLQFVTICPARTNTAMRARIASDASESQDPRAVAAVVTNIIDGSAGYKSGDTISVRDGAASIASRLEK
jgi:short-subunit dehydrogenase